MAEEKGPGKAPEIEKPKSDKVLISRKALDEILETMKRLEEGQERLDYAADKGRVAKFNSRKQGKIVRVARLRLYAGKIVVGWAKMDVDVVQKRNGIWSEEQIITVFTEDYNPKREDGLDTSTGKYKMQYTDFIQMEKIKCEIIEKAEMQLTEEDKVIYGWDPEEPKLFYGLKVVAKGPHYGKTFKLAESFINA